MSHRESVVVFINQAKVEFEGASQTGRSIKQRACIPLDHTLCIEEDRKPDDHVLKCGDEFHSSPPANYGSAVALTAADVGFDRFEAVKQPDGWTFLMVPNFPMPEGFEPRATQLLIKLPPQFPDAAPDMFWVSPHVRVEPGNGAPQGTSTEVLLGAEWQRFSWHLLPGAWRAGSSTLRDYMRCVRARLEKRN